MTECGDQITVAGEGLRQRAVSELSAADAVTEQDQCLDLVDGFAADGDVERERSHGDGSWRGHRRIVQSDCRRGNIRCRASDLHLHPAGLVGVRVCCDKQGGERGQEAPKKVDHVRFPMVVEWSGTSLGKATH